MRLLLDMYPVRADDSTGLVAVELGTNMGHLCTYLALRGWGLLSELHTVDWYYESPLTHEEVADRFAEIGFETCSHKEPLVASAPHPIIAMCSAVGSPRLKVFIHKALTQEAGRVLQDHSVDLVFVDGDHSYAGAKRDIDAWLSKVRPGGIMSGHDFRFGVGSGERRRLYDGDVRHAVAEAFHGDVFLDSDAVWWTHM